MDRQKFVKRFTIFAVTLASVGFIATSAISLWELARAPVPLRITPPTQDSQAESQANSALEVLKNQPADEPAIASMEAVFTYYARANNRPKAIETLEKLQKAAPNSPNTSRYKLILTELQKSPSPSPSSASPSASSTPKPSKSSK
jgi:hypothetical protein